ncbi:hypothetical protein SteCoe_14694 [Stentor coeruleus]|uniref:Uncharacterized protein n=1 Tax=Stentor coeruleus TaxID=5963 RepID=A0A1R2C5F5_9CILI|nr:hypothetical protein SteCoe_14694 [Stentor coeruleus]
MHRQLKTDISGLYVSGTSSPIKAQAGRTFSVDFHKARTITSTPDARISLSSKWYIRGHKFITLYKNQTKPKPQPMLSILGTTHKRVSTPGNKQRLLVTQECKVRRVSQIVEYKNKSIFVGNSFNGEVPKCSSISLQVDFQDLCS